MNDGKQGKAYHPLSVSDGDILIEDRLFERDVERDEQAEEERAILRMMKMENGLERE